jgi:hypothetical protein
MKTTWSIIKSVTGRKINIAGYNRPCYTYFIFTHFNGMVCHDLSQVGVESSWISGVHGFRAFNKIYYHWVTMSARRLQSAALHNTTSPRHPHFEPIFINHNYRTSHYRAYNVHRLYRGSSARHSLISLPELLTALLHLHSEHHHLSPRSPTQSATSYDHTRTVRRPGDKCPFHQPVTP